MTSSPEGEVPAVPEGDLRRRAGYLGPPGTFTEEALLASVAPDASATGAIEPVALETIRDALIEVQDGRVEWAVVPIENSIEGSVTVTLDTLVGDASDVAIVGEVVLPVRHCLIARRAVALEAIDTVISHPHVPGQCTRFLRERIPHARFVAATSTAEAVRLLAERQTDSVAAIGTRLAAELYSCVVLQESIQDREDNETRFVWLERRDSRAGPPPWRGASAHACKTSIVFWGPGADRAGWLVRCLDEFARRDINLTKIESRPRRERLGHYMFFVDLEGSPRERAVTEALDGIGGLCEQVRVLGSYPSVA